MQTKHAGPVLRVEDVMRTAVVALHETDTVGEARAEMDLASFRHLPIVDENNHVVGVVSARDVLAPDAATTVAAVMRRHVVTVHPELPAHRAAHLLAAHKIGSLPVVGDDEQLVGIVTETDFLRIAEAALRGVDVTRTSPPSR